MRRAGTPVKPLTPPSPDPNAHPWAGSGYGVYFLTIAASAGKDRDPDAALLQRFASHVPPVKPASASFVDKHAKNYKMAAVTDRKTGEPGIVFSIGPIRWMSKNRVQVQAGYFAGGLCAQSSTFTLVRQRGRWIVTKISETIVS